MLGIMGVSLISPVLPELRPAFGISDAEAGLIITAFALPGVFFTPVIGLLADRLGRKQVLIPLLFTYGASGAAITFTTEFAIVIALRISQGLGATALIMLAVTLIGDIYEGTQRDALIGVNGSMVGFGAGFFPLVGGTLGGIAWNFPFLVYGVGILVGAFAIVLVEEPVREDLGDDIRTYLKRLFAAARSQRALVMFSAYFLAVFVLYGGVITTVPLLLSDEFGLNPELIGPVLAIASLTQALTASQYGRISQLRRGPELAGVGFAALGSGMLVIWTSGNIPTISVGLLTFGVGIGLVFPSLDTIIITEFSDKLRAGIMGLRTSMLRLGQTGGPIVFTGVAESFFMSTVEGYRVLLFVIGTLVISLGSITYMMLRR